jgi:hypothetical protein
MKPKPIDIKLVGKKNVWFDDSLKIIGKQHNLFDSVNSINSTNSTNSINSINSSNSIDSSNSNDSTDTKSINSNLADSIGSNNSLNFPEDFFFGNSKINTNSNHRPNNNPIFKKIPSHTNLSFSICVDNKNKLNSSPMLNDQIIKNIISCTPPEKDFLLTKMKTIYPKSDGK